MNIIKYTSENKIIIIVEGNHEINKKIFMKVLKKFNKLVCDGI